MLLASIGSAAVAETAGPPVPPVPKISPAQVAMADYKRAVTPSALPQPCARARAGELVVCGQDGSPDRLPLPDERGAREGERTAIGEPPHTGVGGSPVHTPPLTGITLTLKGGKPTVKGNEMP